MERNETPGKMKDDSLKG
ncbi:Protein CBG25633 [Caenorhabditis briggsae]|uniref:Protein CBG25633 n=1 Tax=Caenorhabditis briggsae TaxID=6238 RepID=B6IFB7_CAEBR|nr:Protein CBG25633 [Caenorhabditis briggsae]CAR98597.1 Protein CBG25633 [Caenorhabditis briggsae]